jgi:hypothetical protein
MRDIAQCLRTRPAIHFLGAVVPEPDRPVCVTHDNRIVCELQKVGLLSQYLLGSLALADIADRATDEDSLAVSRALRLISTGNVLPSLRWAARARPLPIGRVCGAALYALRYQR